MALQANCGRSNRLCGPATLHTNGSSRMQTGCDASPRQGPPLAHLTIYTALACVHASRTLCNTALLLWPCDVCMPWLGSGTAVLLSGLSSILYRQSHHSVRRSCAGMQTLTSLHPSRCKLAGASNTLNEQNSVTIMAHCRHQCMQDCSPWCSSRPYDVLLHAWCVSQPCVSRDACPAFVPLAAEQRINTSPRRSAPPGIGEWECEAGADRAEPT
jgi:hypothetical protein